MLIVKSRTVQVAHGRRPSLDMDTSWVALSDDRVSYSVRVIPNYCGSCFSSDGDDRKPKQAPNHENEHRVAHVRYKGGQDARTLYIENPGARQNLITRQNRTPIIRHQCLGPKHRPSTEPGRGRPLLSCDIARITNVQLFRNKSRARAMTMGPTKRKTGRQKGPIQILFRIRSLAHARRVVMRGYIFVKQAPKNFGRWEEFEVYSGG
jgi:hypothetical protein